MGYLWGIYSGYFMGIVPYHGLFIRAPAHYMYMIGRNFDICLIGSTPLVFRVLGAILCLPSEALISYFEALATVTSCGHRPKMPQNIQKPSSSNSSNQPWLAGQFPIQTQFEKQNPSQKPPWSSGISTWRFNRDHCPIQKLIRMI